MAVTEEIAWGDGSGDKIYLTADAFGGNQTVLVSSDANAGAARTKTVTFTAGNITQQLTVNQSAGTIQPVFYHALVFDGTAYIATSYVLPSGCSVHCSFGYETEKKAQSIFLAGGGGGYLGVSIGGGSNSTRRQMIPYYDSSSYLATNRYLNWSNKSYELFMTQKRFGWGNTAYTYTKGSAHPTGGLLVGTTGGSTPPFTGKMATLRVYGSDTANVTTAAGFDSYTPVATFRPCTYNGEAGLWYVEGSTFFGNTAGAGTLNVESE